MVLETLDFFYTDDPATVSSKLTSLGAGKLEQAEAQAVQDHVWFEAGLHQFPGLRNVKKPWMKCLAYTAKQLARNIKGVDLVKLAALLDHDPITAYGWWKQGNVERAREFSQAQSELTHQDQLRPAPLRLGRAHLPTPPVEPQGALPQPQSRPFYQPTPRRPDPRAPQTSQLQPQPSPNPPPPTQGQNTAKVQRTLLSLLSQRNEIRIATSAVITAEERYRQAEIEHALGADTAGTRAGSARVLEQARVAYHAAYATAKARKDEFKHVVEALVNGSCDDEEEDWRSLIG